MNSVLMYIIQNVSEMPTQVQPNTAYYIIGQEVRIIDNMGGIMTFKLENAQSLESRLISCEQKIDKIVKHLTSFTEG